MASQSVEHIKEQKAEEKTSFSHFIGLHIFGMCIRK